MDKMNWEDLMRADPQQVVRILKAKTEGIQREVLPQGPKNGPSLSQHLYSAYLAKNQKEKSKSWCIYMAESQLGQEMGEGLYSIFDNILEQQRNEQISWLQSSGRKPEVLWHTTDKGDNISVFEPKENETMFGETKDNYVFATDDKLEARAYVMHGVTYLNMVGIRFGKNGPANKFCLLKDRELFLEYRKNNPCFTYTLPSETFVPVVSRDGRFANEWVSKSPVEVVPSKTRGPFGIEDVLKKGIQVFFTANPDDYDNTVESFQGLKDNSTRFSHMAGLIEGGRVIHENQVRNICPMSFGKNACYER
ncbi:MAG: hypothetical protein ACM3UU_09390 [Ignavibacteriales bacterium]